MSEPIIEFQSDEEMVECLQEWQTRLFLDDWIIKIMRVPVDQMPEEAVGWNDFCIENKSAVIRLVIPNEDISSRIVKYSQEKTLVHELLHCKYNFMRPPDTYEARYLDTVEHGLLEQMAKSLVMAKYRIGLDWFVNFT